MSDFEGKIGDLGDIKEENNEENKEESRNSLNEKNNENEVKYQRSASFYEEKLNKWVNNGVFKDYVAINILL